MELYARAEITGAVIKPPIKSKSKTGLDYMRFVLGVPNPTIANNSKEWSYYECTVWDSNLIKKIQLNYPHQKDVINVEGQLLIQKFNNNAYTKVLVRDYRVVSITEVKEEEKTFTDMDNTVQEFNENTNTEDMVKEEDYNNSF